MQVAVAHGAAAQLDAAHGRRPIVLNVGAARLHVGLVLTLHDAARRRRECRRPQRLLELLRDRNSAVQGVGHQGLLMTVASPNLMPTASGRDKQLTWRAVTGG